MNHERFLCTIDPISLTGLALGALAGGGAAAASGALGGGASAPAAPTAPPTQTQAVPTAQSPAPKAGGTTGAQPTFLGAAATPPVQSGSKTLLGA